MKNISFSEIIILIISSLLILTIFFNVIDIIKLTSTIQNSLTGILFALLGVLFLIKEVKVASILFFIASLLFLISAIMK
jgi:hypothetical protein